MSELLSCSEGHIKNLFESWQENTEAFRGEAGDPGSLSSWKSYIGIPINSQKESVIVTI